MANMTVINCDTGNVVVELEGAEDGLLRNVDTDEAVTFREGTILARATGSLKFEPYAPAGSGGLNLPVAVLTYDILDVPAVSDVAVRVLIAGKVNSRRLVIHGDPPTPITAAHLDLLRSFAIVAVDVQQLGVYENTQG